jgi:exosortase/archaeosortase family protein
VAGNVVRITTVAVVAQVVGGQQAVGFYERYSGYLVFVVAIILMMAIGHVLEADFKKRLAAWTKPCKETPL